MDSEAITGQAQLANDDDDGDDDDDDDHRQPDDTTLRAARPACLRAVHRSFHVGNWCTSSIPLSMSCSTCLY